MACCCSPQVGLRLATLVVLMISDLDFMFSFLFMYSLLKKYFESKQPVMFAFIGVILMGMMSYFVGVVYYGPLQKDKIAALVKSFMQMNADKCYTTKWVETGPGTYVENVSGDVGHPYQVGMQQRVCPSSKDKRKFSQLNLDVPEDRDYMRSGLTEWGLQDVWDAVEKRNAWNCLDMEHGIPFVRLAKFGFQAQPAPKELGGILNANALYTAACGIPQLAIGSIILVTQLGDDPDMENVIISLVPLAISSVSLVLSIFNVICNFSAMLVQMENEENMVNSITASNEARNRKKKDELDKKYHAKVTALEQEFDPEQAGDSAAVATTRALAMTEAHENYMLSANQLSNDACDLVELELTNYRLKVVRVLAALSGKINRRQQEQSTTAAELVAKEQAVKNKLKAEINKLKCKKLEEVTAKVGTLSAEQLGQEMQHIEREHADMISATCATHFKFDNDDGDLEKGHDQNNYEAEVELRVPNNPRLLGNPEETSRKV